MKTMKYYMQVGIPKQIHIWRIWIKYFWARLPYKLVYCFVLLGNKRGRKSRILCFPDLPSQNNVLYKICHLLGVEMTNKPQEVHDLAIFYSQSPQLDDHSALHVFANKNDIINWRCRDISKEFVDQVHLEVFSYSLNVDPGSWVGPVVQKSNDNATHDGSILTGPIQSPIATMVYQRLIDNTSSDDFFVIDYRVPIYKMKIPFVYYKYRPITSRFSNKNSRVELHTSEDTFSQDELQKILLFCDKIGLDFGELDILRDQKTGKIYIVDVNPTPSGPPNHSTRRDYIYAIKTLSTCFKDSFLPDRK